MVISKHQKQKTKCAYVHHRLNDIFEEKLSVFQTLSLYSFFNLLFLNLAKLQFWTFFSSFEDWLSMNGSWLSQHLTNDPSAVDKETARCLQKKKPAPPKKHSLVFPEWFRTLYLIVNHENKKSNFIARIYSVIISFSFRWFSTSPNLAIYYSCSFSRFSNFCNTCQV